MQNAQELHCEFIKFGRIRLSLKNKMLAMLPDIYESGIWKKYAGSIVEYCAKYGDIARTTVLKRLGLEPDLEGKPFLKAAIETAGVHKVAMVAKLASSETDKDYADKVINMSKAAVQTLSKEMRAAKKSSVEMNESEVGLELFEVEGKSENIAPPCSAVPTLKKIELDADASFLFMKLKAKFGKHLSDSKFMKTILEATDAANEKAISARKKKVELQNTFTHESNNQNCPHGSSLVLVPSTPLKVVTGEKGKSEDGQRDSERVKPVTRYIPIVQKRAAIAKTQGRCSYPNCNRPYDVIHHTDRYSDSKSHKSIVLFCKVHHTARKRAPVSGTAYHEFAHNNLIENEKLISCVWRMSVVPNPKTKISLADVLYRKYRQKAVW